uniref:F-box protein n=1 Tax=Cucumis melo TaxID=3656 RepID=A0A9I9D844_CUCME
MVNESLSFWPPWEVLLLVGGFLDPKTLAMAACVCKSWSIALASDHLWEPILAHNFPSLFNRTVSSTTTSPPLSFCRLFGLGHIAATRCYLPFFMASSRSLETQPCRPCLRHRYDLLP